MSARVVRGALPLAVACLLASSARAEVPDAPPPAPPAAQEPGPSGVIVIVPAPPFGYPPPAYEPPPPPYPYLPPPPYPYPSQSGAPPVEPWSRDRGFSAKIYAGPSYERIFDSSIPGADIGIFLGGVRGSSGWYGGFDASLGRMGGALFTAVVRPGATWEARIGRVHLGLGFELVVAGVQRATTGDFITSFGVGGSAFGSVDLVQGERNALFLGVKMRADGVTGAAADGSAPVLWGPSAALGWRYR